MRIFAGFEEPEEGVDGIALILVLFVQRMRREMYIA